MRAFVKHNGLSLAFLGMFLAALVLQAIAGLAEFNEDQDRYGDPRISFLRYVTSTEFGGAVMENWQSEYLQFTLFILLTVWLVQRGSPESKEPGKAGRESDQEQKVGEHADPRSPRWAKVGGRRPCRTGSPSSSPSARWPSSRSTCGTAARPSRSRSGLRTTRRASRGQKPTKDLA